MLPARLLLANPVNTNLGFGSPTKTPESQHDHHDDVHSGCPLRMAIESSGP